MAEPVALPAALQARFPALAGRITAPRGRRVFAEVPAEAFREVLDFACAELGFDQLITITGLDAKESLAALYSLSRADGTVLSLRLTVPRDRPVIRSVTDRFPGGENYERELSDLLGFEVEGLPPGRRYPLPDDWPLDQKPLRKDWKPAPRGGAGGSSCPG